MTTVTTSEALKNTDPSEPIFVLCARDPLTKSVVRHWITLARQAGVKEEKLKKALETLSAIDNWPHRKQPEEL